MVENSTRLHTITSKRDSHCEKKKKKACQTMETRNGTQIPIVPKAKGAKSAVGLPPKKNHKGHETNRALSMF